MERYLEIILSDECNNNAISGMSNPYLCFSWANLMRSNQFAVLYNVFISSVTFSINGI